MTSIDELGQKPDLRRAVPINVHEEIAQRLYALVVTIKDAVAMDIRIGSYIGAWRRHCCAVSIYHPNNKSISAARKERLRLSAISMSSEQSQTATTGDSVWLGIEPYAALFTHGERREFVFEVGPNLVTDSSVKTFVTDLGLTILRNAHLVECLRVHVTTDSDTGTLQLLKTFFSLGAWKEAKSSLRSAYLGCDAWYSWKFDLPPRLLKHVRGLEVRGTVKKAGLPQVESMIRNKDYGIEEVRFVYAFLKHAELLDDTLRRVRSFRVKLAYVRSCSLAESFQRTKAHGDNLVRLTVDNDLGCCCPMAMVKRICGQDQTYRCSTWVRCPCLISLCFALSLLPRSSRH